MKAAVYTRYGGPEVLQVKEIAKPIPKDNEVLIRICATAVNSADVRLRKADPFAMRFVFGLFKPRKPILGGVLSGVIEAVGKNIAKFRAGDQVFGATQMNLGAYAEYTCLAGSAPLALKPGNLSHEEAASLPFGGLTAWHFLQKARIRPGQKVLVYGASGAVGSAAVQIAKSLGAEVTGVCSSANVELVRSLGADQVIDYTQSDFTASGKQYDVIYETVDKAPFSACLAALKADGTLILGATLLTGMLRGTWTSATTKTKVIFGVTNETAEGVEFLKKLAEAGKLKPVIDKTFTLEQIAAAHEYVDQGHKKGNVVIRVM